jgi:pimeloyl-ACP methyl ester carboxylesterase
MMFVQSSDVVSIISSVLEICHKERAMKVSKSTFIIVATLVALMVGCSPVEELQKEGTSTVSSADGSVISYGVQGEGEITVVFVHCWTCNHGFWKPQVDYFAKKHRVAWLDLAGHGSSISKRKDYTMSAFGEDVAAVVNAVGGDKIVLVGHSMGGPVSIEAANLLGDKVIGIVGVDTFYTPFVYPASEEKIEAFVKPFKDDFHGAAENMVRSMFVPEADPAVIESLVKEFAGANREMGISAMYEIFRWSAQNVPGTLDKYGTKLRNINGAPTGEEQALHEGVTLIPGVGHFVAQVKPDEFNQALDSIVVEIGSNSSGE